MKHAMHRLRLVPPTIAICLGVLTIATVAVAAQMIRPSDTAIYNVDGPDTNSVPIAAVLPSMCDGIAPAVGARTGLGEALRSKGLLDEIPADALSHLGSLGTVHCYSDDLHGKLAVVLLNSRRGKAIVLANDQSWADGLRSNLTNEDGVSILPSVDDMDIFIGTTPAESGLPSTHVDTILVDHES